MRVVLRKDSQKGIVVSSSRAGTTFQINGADDHLVRRMCEGITLLSPHPFLTRPLLDSSEHKALSIPSFSFFCFRIKIERKSLPAKEKMHLALTLFEKELTAGNLFGNFMKAIFCSHSLLKSSSLPSTGERMREKEREKRNGKRSKEKKNAEQIYVKDRAPFAPHSVTKQTFVNHRGERLSRDSHGCGEIHLSQFPIDP